MKKGKEQFGNLEFGMNLLCELLPYTEFKVSDKTTKVQNWDELIQHIKEFPRLDKIPLKKKSSLGLAKVLHKRRSVRKYDPTFKLENATISKVLTAIRDARQAGLPKRPFPSAGALYSSNTYCIIHSGVDLQRGLFYYNPKKHQLEVMLLKNLRNYINRAINDRNISGYAATFILTSSYYKSCLKYGPRGFLYSLIEIGALAQTINLASIDCGLGCAWIGGFDTKMVTELLDLSAGLEIEIPILLIVFGKPA